MQRDAQRRHRVDALRRPLGLVAVRDPREPGEREAHGAVEGPLAAAAVLPRIRLARALLSKNLRLRLRARGEARDAREALGARAPARADERLGELVAVSPLGPVVGRRADRADAGLDAVRRGREPRGLPRPVARVVLLGAAGVDDAPTHALVLEPVLLAAGVGAVRRPAVRARRRRRVREVLAARLADREEPHRACVRKVGPRGGDSREPSRRAARSRRRSRLA
mmetsp:Transcript_10829/g.33389  ORF Transcript_10829/g.33389 Transcript_10829/m.33389 type:complete len:224 (-) Transcript_10829:125-796(-)